MRIIRALILMSFVFLIACDDDEGTYVLNPDNIAGNIVSQEVDLDSSDTYYLDGELIVENGGVLNIPAGTKIIVKGNTKSYIAVARGGKIYAQGTNKAPVVFTSDVKEAGSWGGLVICGRARTNLMASNSSSPVEAEVTGLLYGGNEQDDNSGELSYVRVEYSGYYYNDDKQFNGFSFFGVGSATIIDHISSYESKDDGIEFFGGKVSAEFLVSINSHDDGIDFTDGWIGNGNYWYSYNSTMSGIEGSNNESNGAAEPITNATLSNITVYKMGQRPWYLKDGAGSQVVENVVIGGLPDNAGYAYFYYEDNDLNVIDNLNAERISFTDVNFVQRGEGNDADASSDALQITTNENVDGAGTWSNDTTLEPAWIEGWAKP